MVQTVYNLVSKAPILEISEATPVQRFFIEEFEIVLAKYRARCTNPQAFEKKLCHTEPLRLYLACLMALIEKLENFQHKDESYRQLLTYLHSQEHRLAIAGLIVNPVPMLDEIFG